MTHPSDETIKIMEQSICAAMDFIHDAHVDDSFRKDPNTWMKTNAGVVYNKLLKALLAYRQEKEKETVCHVYKGEQAFLFQQERKEIEEAVRKHFNGECELSEEELKKLHIRHIILRDAGY